MTAPQDGLASLIAEFENQRKQLTQMQDELASASATVSSPRNEVTVTVGSSGAIEELRFNNRDYRRMGPEELADMITTTIGDARSAVEDQVMKSMTGLTGGGGSAVADMMSGAFDWQSMFPADLAQQLVDGERRPDGKQAP